MVQRAGYLVFLAEKDVSLSRKIHNSIKIEAGTDSNFCGFLLVVARHECRKKMEKRAKPTVSLSRPSQPIGHGPVLSNPPKFRSFNSPALSLPDANLRLLLYLCSSKPET